ncbi:hypothetical protein ACF0H5_000665 [Mactra antiquata]
MAALNDLGGLKSNLFKARTPKTASKNEVLNDTLSKKLQLEHETDEEYKKSEKEAHEKRMKKFRAYAKQIEENDWVYTPMEKLIGLK